jgi:hypothetical protein
MAANTPRYNYAEEDGQILGAEAKNTLDHLNALFVENILQKW